jgi:hypothetical protein
MSAALLMGREIRRLDPEDVFGGRGEIYASQLLDGADVTAQTFEHSTFANISFKKTRIDRCRFVNCAFIDCYFRHTEIESSRFIGCKFITCNFSEPHFMGNTFEFLEFRGCFIPFDTFAPYLPEDPGLKRDIADQLAREAGNAHELRDARRYRLIAERAFESDQWNLAWASGSDYYEKPRPPLLRVQAGLRWAGRKFNRWLWGHGERGLILARSFAIAALAFAVGFRVFLQESLTHDGRGLSTPEYLLYSLDNLLAHSGFSEISTAGVAARWLSGFEVFVGLIFIGLFVSLAFNWIRRR